MFTILMVDDDADDCLLVREALAETGLRHRLRTACDGEELLQYVRSNSGRGERTDAVRPDLLLLDLNMPRKDGRESLRELRKVDAWRFVPVIVLTTSMAEDDIQFCYAAGANSYVTKPSTYRAWVDLMRALTAYWFETVQLPRDA